MLSGKNNIVPEWLFIIKTFKFTHKTILKVPTIKVKHKTD
jgi:hypothetical protein